MFPLESQQRFSVQKADSTRFVQYPFVVTHEQGKYKIAIYTVNEETFNTNRPEPTKIVGSEMAEAMATMILFPHIFMSTLEWEHRTNHNENALNVLKYRFKKILDPSFAQQIFPRYNGHIFSPLGGYLNPEQLPSPHFFTAHDVQFVVSQNGQFVAFYQDEKKVQKLTAEKVFFADNAEYVLPRPVVGTLLFILAENFGEEVPYAEIVRQLYTYRQVPIPTDEMLEIEFHNLQTPLSLIRKFLPEQLCLKIRYGKGVALRQS